MEGRIAGKTATATATPTDSNVSLALLLGKESNEGRFRILVWGTRSYASLADFLQSLPPRENTPGDGSYPSPAVAASRRHRRQRDYFSSDAAGNAGATSAPGAASAHSSTTATPTNLNSGAATLHHHPPPPPPPPPSSSLGRLPPWDTPSSVATDPSGCGSTTSLPSVGEEESHLDNEIILNYDTAPPRGPRRHHRHPWGAPPGGTTDVSDWFNYGFDEESFKRWIQWQLASRRKKSAGRPTTGSIPDPSSSSSSSASLADVSCSADEGHIGAVDTQSSVVNADEVHSEIPNMTPLQ